MLEIEHRDLGDTWVEGFFLLGEVSSYLALQVGLPEPTVRARIIEAHGYCRRPPKGGKKIMLLADRFGQVEEQAINAMRCVVFDFVTAGEVEEILSAYCASDYGDAFQIAFELEAHPYIVISVLSYMREKGTLPRHPSQIEADTL